MDGHFVPNITVGPPVVRSLRKATALPLDCHLMIENADRYVDAFADAGANWISLHVEAMPHLQRTVAHLRSRGLRPGVVLNPATPLDTLDEILPEVDYVLVMSVNPGFGGQAFLPSSLDKIRRLKTAHRRARTPHRDRGGRRRRPHQHPRLAPGRSFDLRGRLGRLRPGRSRRRA